MKKNHVRELLDYLIKDGDMCENNRRIEYKLIDKNTEIPTREMFDSWKREKEDEIRESYNEGNSNSEIEYRLKCLSNQYHNLLNFFYRSSQYTTRELGSFLVDHPDNVNFYDVDSVDNVIKKIVLARGHSQITLSETVDYLNSMAISSLHFNTPGNADTLKSLKESVSLLKRYMVYIINSAVFTKMPNSEKDMFSKKIAMVSEFLTNIKKFDMEHDGLRGMKTWTQCTIPIPCKDFF